MLLKERLPEIEPTLEPSKNDQRGVFAAQGASPSMRERRINRSYDA
jgi:hypothetical protein